MIKKNINKRQLTIEFDLLNYDVKDIDQQIKVGDDQDAVDANKWIALYFAVSINLDFLLLGRFANINCLNVKMRIL